MKTSSTMDLINSSNQWQFWIDRGGTFTDVVARTPKGQLLTRKLLSENPEHYKDAALEAMRQILGGKLEGRNISAVKMGTTVGTNALLERKGEPTALLITSGYKDCLRIAYQNRPHIFALNIQLPELLYSEVIEIEERIDVSGNVLISLDRELNKQKIQQLYNKGYRAIAIVLMHSWRYPRHELQLAQLAKEIGFPQISISHQVSPFMKIVSRGDTTVIDAYLSPILKRYVAQVSIGLAAKNSPRLMFMQSNGGLTDADCFQGKDSILSGPAGGIVGAVATAEYAGFKKIIAFDMGGTSTDVAHYCGELERSFETKVADVRMRVPMMNIHTVAAGGGSLLFFDGMRYRVGPESAGANPGPAAYRRGGGLTVTDANVMLGKLPLFPKIFGEKGNLSLDQQKVEQLFSELASEISHNTQGKPSLEQVAEGFLTIAVENMATAIKKISVQKGYNVSEYTLCCYGAAGAQHACKVADRLGMKTIMIHPFAGVLSAYGMGLADYRLLKDKAIETPWNEFSEEQLTATFCALKQQGDKEIRLQAQDKQPISFICQVYLRYMGTDTALAVVYSDKTAMLAQFEALYQQQFGFKYKDKAIIIESLLVEVIAKNQTVETFSSEMARQQAQPLKRVKMFTNNSFHHAPIYQRSALLAGQIIKGAAVIIEPTSTIIIEPEWQALVSAEHNLILTRTQALQNQNAIGTQVDPVMLEIFTKLFMSIAEQMGFVLQKTAYSVNIKERLDFSCALFNQQGELIANAPHIPVHLGSMAEAVQALLRTINIQQGEVYLSNSPYQGGTHLPDITVISPVFSEQNELLFYVASRGHHADVGGITAASMPAHSHHIDEEGVLSAGLKIVQNDQFQEQVVRDWLKSSKYPARNSEQNIADLQAQIAANNKGVLELKKMVAYYSLDTVKSYMQHVQNNAAETVRRLLPRLKNGCFEQRLDNGSKIVVNISINTEQQSAIIDFTGTSRQTNNNFNAPAAVCKAAVLYVFRTLVNDDIPLNSGCLQPLQIIIPEGSMLNPIFPAAVVAGNVETSQHIVDALYGALGVLTGSQGTMNNFTFGNEQYQYYETICGGSGAGKGFNGCDAVQTHMTNSRITDPEVLEWRYPVLLEEFSIRKNTGGKGLFTGGNGVLRRIKFLTPLTASILSSHRIQPSFGLLGGCVGAVGENKLIRFNGEIIKLESCAQISLQAGDCLEIKTPAGGGYGAI